MEILQPESFTGVYFVLRKYFNRYHFVHDRGPISRVSYTLKLESCGFLQLLTHESPISPSPFKFNGIEAQFSIMRYCVKSN